MPQGFRKQRRTGLGHTRGTNGLNFPARTVTNAQKRIAGTLVTVVILVSLAVALGWRVSATASAGSAGFTYFGVPTDEQLKLDKVGLGMFRQPPRAVLVVIPGSSADRAGLEVGNLIHSINGIDVSDLDKLRELDRTLVTGDELIYEVERQGVRLKVPVLLESPLAVRATLVGMISSLLLGFAYLAISTFVFLMKPDSRLTFVFYVTCLVGAMVFFVGSFQDIEGMARGIFPASGFNAGPLIAFFVYAFLATLMLSLLLHLSLIFPRERPLAKKYPSVIHALYFLPFIPTLSLAVVLGMIALLASIKARWALTPSSVGLVLIPLAALIWLYFRGRKEGRSGNFVLRHALAFTLSLIVALAGVFGLLINTLSRETVTLVFMFVGGFTMLWVMVAGVVYSILTCGMLIMSYRESGVEEKRQVRWPLWGTIVTLGATAAIAIGYMVAMNISPLLVGRFPNFAQAVSLAIKFLFLLIPISFAFGILKYRLMEIDVIIKKTLIYGIVTGVVVVLYLALVGGLGTVLVQYAGVKNQTITVVSTLVIAALFIPVRSRVQKLVDRRFFRRRFDYPATLATLDEKMPHLGELEAQARFAAERLQQAAQTRSVTVFVKEPGEPFAPTASIGLPDGRVEKTRLNFTVDQLQGDPVVPIDSLKVESDEVAKLEHLDASLVVMVISRGEPVGVMTVGPKLSREAFDDEDRDFFVGVASRLAEAIDLQRDRKQTAESRQAADIQQALLPSVIPQIPGFSIAGMSLPARAVGGDYYDVLALDDETVMVCIADVCGKGMTAALMMSGLQSAVRSLAEPDSSPSQTVNRIRKVVCSNLSGGKFITFFYGLLDSSSSSFRYTNAGHNAPVLVRESGQVERLKEGGGILGRLLMNTPLNEGEIRLNAGDRLVLFTDGVSEARNLEEEEMGEDRLTDLIAQSSAANAEELRIEILEAVREFSGGNFHDDVTLAVVMVH